MFKLILILSWLLLGYITSRKAVQRGRDPIFWFFMGAFFGLFGLLVLFLLPRPMKKLEPKGAPIESLPQPTLPNELKGKMWYYLDAQEQQQGPISFERLKEVWRQKEISEKTFIWTESLDEWKSLKDALKVEWLDS